MRGGVALAALEVSQVAEDSVQLPHVYRLQCRSNVEAFDNAVADVVGEAAYRNWTAISQARCTLSPLFR